ncbi:MAG: hypothetical protein IJ324_02775 [Lachnospiraceae bacterium]|nr:hypothetical protein [Lachnospiraceae bacterium]
MKKRFVSILVSSMLVVSLFTGCGSSEAPAANSETAPAVSEEASAQESSQQSVEEQVAEPGYVYSQGGVDVAVNGEMAPIVEAWGEPDKYFESESCAFQGMDKVYTYGSVVINTYPENDKDYVLTIELKDDTITTAEGIYIGSSKEDVVATYGAATSETDVALVYDKGECQLTFFFEDDCVTNITYAAKMD